MADIEAGGFAWIQADCQVLAYSDEVLAEGFQHESKKSFTVVALEPGHTTVEYQSPELRAASTALKTFHRETVPLPFAGCGYLADFSGEVIVDQQFRLDSPGAPVPFFFSIAGTGTARIIPARSNIELIDSFTIDDLAALKARAFAAQNISKLSSLDSFLPDGTRRLAGVASHLNPASWTVPVPACDGVLLIRTYDRFHGRQRARVFVDDEFLGYWYQPEQDRVRRWAMGRFGVPAVALRGKSQVRITIDPPPGTPLWSISRMEAYALFDG